jgi:hypothetical protein
MKKKLHLFFGVVMILAITSKLHAQSCSFISPTVEITNIGTNVAGNCELTINLSFDIITNSGNKFIFVHLWKQANYPGLSYSTNQSQPTAAQLANALANFVIDNNNATPVFLSSYGPANSVAVKTAANNPGLTIQRLASSTVGADRMLISGLKITLPGTCSNSFSFQGDAWSSNANSNNPPVQCAMAGFIVGATDPTITSSRTCNSYTFNVSTVASTAAIYYDVYMDDGDGLFDPPASGGDILVGTLSSANAVTITPSTPYSTGSVILNAPYNSSPYTTRKMYIALSVVGKSFISLVTIAAPTGSCGLVPITLTDFYAQRKNSTTVNLTWKTQTEINAKGFDVERKTDNGFIKIAFVTASNIQTGSVYAYQDNNDSKTNTQYRIKLVDKDGNFKTSEIRNVNGTGSVSDFTIFPNPSSGNTKVSISDIGQLTDVQLIDNAGRVIKSITLGNSNQVDLNNLQKGLYLVRIINKITGEFVTKKLTVIK